MKLICGSRMGVMRDQVPRVAQVPPCGEGVYVDEMEVLGSWGSEKGI